MPANGTCCCHWECSHCSQATSKEKHSNLHARGVAHPVWISAIQLQTHLEECLGMADLTRSKWLFCSLSLQLTVPEPLLNTCPSKWCGRSCWMIHSWLSIDYKGTNFTLISCGGKLTTSEVSDRPISRKCNPITSPWKQDHTEGVDALRARICEMLWRYCTTNLQTLFVFSPKGLKSATVECLNLSNSNTR